MNIRNIENHFTGNYTLFYQKYLPSVKKIGGDEYQAICPFHDDKKPSFNFNNKTGKYYCHGCGKKGDLIHFYAKINNFDHKRDFPKILKGIADDFRIPWEEQKAKMVKAYDYMDRNGNLLFQVCRMEPKDFRQRRPDANGKWIWNLKGVNLVPYNLPKVIAAEEVIIVEGEKDVETAAKMGLTATTCPMGARKWRDEFNRFLEGKDIVLIPDNDIEGREHMTQVAISLNGTAKSLKWIDLPDLASKGDLSDWVAKFDDSTDAGEQLSILIEKAGPYEPPKKQTLEDIIISVQDFRVIEIQPRRVFLRPWLRENGIVLIVGWRGIGKTWFVLGILNAVSKGKAFGSWECKASVPCLFLDGEMPTSDMHERIDVLDLHSDRENPLYIYSDHYANQFGIPRAHLANESWRTKMKSILITRGIRLFAIDNLASLAAGLDENSKRDYDPLNQWLLELRFAGITTIMLHHENKQGGQRGTSAREDNIDVSISLKYPHDYTPEDGARFVAHFSKARIPTADLQLIADTEFRLIQDEGSQSVWTWGSVKKKTQIEILKLLDEGIPQKEIGELLGVTKGYVSRIKTQAIQDNHLGKNERLTQSGFDLVYEGSDRDEF